MYQYSSRFAQRLRESHVVVTECYLQDSSGVKIMDLKFTDGQVTIDDVTIRRTATVRVVVDDPDLVPAGAGELMSPLSGNEVVLRRGVKYDDGTTEVLPVGVFRIRNSDLDDSGPSQAYTLDLADRTFRIQRNRVTTSRTFTATSPFTIAQTLLRTAMPDIQFVGLQSSPVSANTTIQVEEESDPWDVATKQLRNIGCEAFFTPTGYCEIALLPVTDAIDPVWEVVEGVNSVLLNMVRRLEGDSFFNSVIVVSEFPGRQALRGVAQDTSNAATSIYGPNGVVPFFIRDPSIGTQAAADARAKIELTDKIGWGELLSMNVLPHPGLDLRDGVLVQRADSKVNATYIVDAISLPMIHNRPMFVAFKRRRE